MTYHIKGDVMSTQAIEKRRHPIVTIALLAIVALAGWGLMCVAVLSYSVVAVDYISWIPLIQEVLMVPAEPLGLGSWVMR